VSWGALKAVLPGDNCVGMSSTHHIRGAEQSLEYVRHTKSHFDHNMSCSSRAVVAFGSSSKSLARLTLAPIDQPSTLPYYLKLI